VFLSKTAGMGLGFVMKILDGGLNLRATIITDPLFVVQYPRNRPDGYSRSFGDILDGGHGVAPGQIIPAQDIGSCSPSPLHPKLFRNGRILEIRGIICHEQCANGRKSF
jgi:hypothetical protein